MKAVSEIGRTKHLPAGKRRSFTLIELLVVIAIIAILAGLVMPALNKARASAVSASCVSNLRQLGMVMMRYSDGNQGFIPPTYSIYEGKEMSWADLCIVRNYLAKPREGNEVIFRCPKLGLQYSGDYSESYGGDAGTFDVDFKILKNALGCLDMDDVTIEFTPGKPAPLLVKSGIPWLAVVMPMRRG